VKIVQIASEGVPFSKTGGLADVVGSLSLEEAREGHQVALILPLYHHVNREKFKIKPLKKSFLLPFPDGPERVSFYQTQLHENCRAYFVYSEKYFNRRGIYGDTPDGAYDDNHRRFALFNRAAVELLKILKWAPDIIHCHDWQTGILPAYLKSLYFSDPFFFETATVFTIHNMAYQGVFPLSSFLDTGLPVSEFHPEGLEFYGQINFLKAGLIYSDAVNTVSPTYADEIRNNPAFGHNLEGVLQSRGGRFKGITNGLDTDIWNPQTDPYIASNYDSTSLENRKLCRMDLLKTAGWKLKDSSPLLGYVGRLDLQKGIDFIIGIIPTLVQAGVKTVVLGRGDSISQLALQGLMARYPKHVFAEHAFREPLAHQIYAGTDLFLMPSRFEPCGLSQMIAMRYGSIPVVNATGGLLDTVKNVNDRSDGTGFISYGKTQEAYLHDVLNALNRIKEEPFKTELQKRSMSQDFSWETSVHEYLEWYEKTLEWYFSDHA